MHRKHGPAARVSDEGQKQTTMESTMRALQDFLSTDYGLMSLAVITITLGMGAFFARYFAQHIKADTDAARRRGGL